MFIRGVFTAATFDQGPLPHSLPQRTPVTTAFLPPWFAKITCFWARLKGKRVRLYLPDPAAATVA